MDAAGRILASLDDLESPSRVSSRDLTTARRCPRAKCTLYDPGIEAALRAAARRLAAGGGARDGEQCGRPVLLEALMPRGGAPGHQRVAAADGSAFSAPCLAGDVHTYYEPMRAIGQNATS
jgi:hypothetical protein